MSKLYHYTSGDSLLGILQSQTFWATDIRFLNDYEELNRGLELIETFVSDLVSEMDDSTAHLKELVEIVVGNIRRNANLTLINLVSFSTECDNLRQWMAYCNSGIGYCIEFDSETLVPESFKDFETSLRLAPVEYLNNDMSIYSSDVGLKFKEILVTALSAFDNNISEKYLIDEFSLKVNRLLVDSIFLASTIKPVEFSDEREVRLLYIGNNKESAARHDIDGLYDIYKKPTLPDVGFKSKSDILVSYQPIPFSIASVKKVTIGPSANPKLAELGLTEFRDRNNFNFDIVHSSCSLRRL